MKAGWELQTLGDLTMSINGLWKGKKPPFVTAQVIRNTNFRSHGILNLDDVAILEVEQKQFDKRQLQVGDIILEKSGGGPKQPVGRVVCFEETQNNFSFSNFTTALRINRPNLLIYKYLHLYLNYLYENGDTEPLQRQSTGIRNLNLPSYKNLSIPLPPLEEQNRIVSILDEAFEGLDRARENAEANLKSARELFESALNTQIITDLKKYGTKQISELCETIVDCLNRTAPKVPGPTDYKMVRTTNIRNGVLNLEKVNYVEESTYITWTRRQTPMIGDVLLTREAPMGEAAIVDTEDKIFLGQRVVSYRTKSDLLVPDYLLLCFQSKSMQDEFSRLGSGATVQHIRVPQSKELLVSYPPINEQSKAVSRLKQLLKQSNELQFVHQTKLQDISDLRQSLLQKAFAGELT